MAQVGHPYSAQVKASQKRRLRVLGATAGKSWGGAASQQTSHYPSKHAGTERPLTISGGTAPKRADRKSAKYARGGGISKGGGKGKKKGATTNIIIAPSGGAGKEPVPVPVPIRPPMGPPPMGPRPVGALPPGGLPVAGPAGPAGPMGPAAPPILPAGARPPGMYAGGIVKKADGGFLKEQAGKAYRGFPHSPTTSVDDAVSAQKRGGAVKKKGYAKGGSVEESKAHERKESKAIEDSEAGDDDDGMKKGGSVKRQLGGPSMPVGGGNPNMDPVDPNKRGLLQPARPTIGRGPMLAPMGGGGYKKGGKAKKHAGGGFVAKDQPSSEYHQQGVGYRARGGGVMAGAGSGKGRLGKIAAAKAVPAKTEL